MNEQNMISSFPYNIAQNKFLKIKQLDSVSYWHVF